MALPTVYTGGTVTLTAGSTAVVGQGTQFLLSRAGDLLWSPRGDGADCRIASIVDNTHLTLAWNWPGESQTAGPYEIRIWSDTARMQEASRQLLEQLSAGNYAHPDAFIKTIGELADYDDKPEGYIVWLTDPAPFTIYAKQSDASGDWSPGNTLQGPPGERGEQGTDGVDGTSFQVNDTGPFEDRADHDGEGEGYAFLATTDGPDPDAQPAGSLYIRITSVAGSWSDAIPFGKGEKGDDGEQGIQGIQGVQGTAGWSPRHALIADSARIVMQLAGYVGGEGTAPTANIGRYVGAAGYVTDIATAINVRGAQGLQGNTGDQGAAGLRAWSPILGVVTDSERRVFQVADWVNGEGTKPTVGQYLGPTGLVSTAAAAVDVRGPQGNQGNQGDKGWAPKVTVQPDGARRVLQLVDYVGGAGLKPTTDVGKYLGVAGWVADIADGLDIRGPQGTQGIQGTQGVQGIQGTQGVQGQKGWGPVLALVSDGARRVFRVVDWSGGEGTKPATGDYLGATGLTSVLANAVDVRGSEGPAGEGSGNFLTDAEEEVADGEFVAFDAADPTRGKGSGVSATSISADIAAAIATIPNPIAMAIIFGS